MAERFYVQEIPLLQMKVTKGQEIRLIIGVKDNGKEYIDLRTWYPSEEDEEKLLPGKGFAKPVDMGWDKIAEAITNREEIRKSGPIILEMRNKKGD